MTTPGFRELGVSVVSDEDPANASITVSNLTIPANMMTDGAAIVCRLFPTPQKIASKVTLTVQG